MTFLFCPSCVTVEEAVDWFHERGIADFVLFRGPDGLVRGSGRK